MVLEMMSIAMMNLMSRDLSTVEVGIDIDIIGTIHLEKTKAILGTKYMTILMM